MLFQKNGNLYIKKIIEAKIFPGNILHLKFQDDFKAEILNWIVIHADEIPHKMLNVNF